MLPTRMYRFLVLMFHQAIRRVIERWHAVNTYARSTRGLISKGPARRRAIAQAAARVLRNSGIEGLTHRAVAEEAGVPLGSTTYYFTSRDDLLATGVEFTTNASIRWMEQWADENADQDIAVTLPKMLHTYLTTKRDAATLDVEIYILAARRQELRVHPHRWTESFIDILARFVDRDTARQVTATVNGLILTGVASDRPASLSEMSRVLERAFGRVDPDP
jgi:TetR/AcrR family transcriptional regulator, regulator of biofilm formation and stress response